jgi:fumarate reductase subunit D
MEETQMSTNEPLDEAFEQSDAQATRPIGDAEPAASGAQAGQSQAGQSQAGQSQAGPSPAEPYQTGPYQTGPYQTGPYQTGPYASGQYTSGQYTSGQYGSEAGAAGSGYASAPYAATGYGPTGYAPAGYAPTGYGYPPAPPRTDDRAVWALVSSIAGYVFLPIILHIVGWVLANQSLRTIRESRGTLGGEGMAKAARILSIVGLVVYSIGALIAILVFAILIPLGVFAASTSDPWMDFEDTTVTPASIAEIDGETFEHDAGDITYDLSGLDFTDRQVDMSVRLGTGTLTVDVPQEVTVVLDAEVGAGEIDAFGQQTDGIAVTRDTTDSGDAEGGTLELDLEVGAGQIEVARG